MKPKRYVPLILGIASLSLAFWLLWPPMSWWSFLLSLFPLAFGWASVKTAIFASDREIVELTDPDLSVSPSKETLRRFQDRL